MMWFCRNCKNLVSDFEDGVGEGGECPVCGSNDLTFAGNCEVCGEDMEEDNPAICPDCRERVQKKWKEFKDGLEDAEIEYFLENIFDWED